MNQTDAPLLKWLQTANLERCVALTLTHRKYAKLKNNPTRANFRASIINYHTLSDTIDCSKNFRLFMNMMNRKIHGRHFKKHATFLSVIPILETDRSGYHYHCLLERPNMMIKDYAALISKSWNRTPHGAPFNRVTHAYNTSGFLSYMTKVVDSQDRLDLDNMNVNSWVKPL